MTTVDIRGDKNDTNLVIGSKNATITDNGDVAALAVPVLYGNVSTAESKRQAVIRMALDAGIDSAPVLALLVDGEQPVKPITAVGSVPLAYYMGIVVDGLETLERFYTSTVNPSGLITATPNETFNHFHTETKNGKIYLWTECTGEWMASGHPGTAYVDGYQVVSAHESATTRRQLALFILTDNKSVLTNIRIDYDIKRVATSDSVFTNAAFSYYNWRIRGDPVVGVSFLPTLANAIDGRNHNVANDYGIYHTLQEMELLLALLDNHGIMIGIHCGELPIVGGSVQIAAQAAAAALVAAADALVLSNAATALATSAAVNAMCGMGSSIYDLSVNSGELSQEVHIMEIFTCVDASAANGFAAGFPTAADANLTKFQLYVDVSLNQVQCIRNFVNATALISIMSGDATAFRSGAYDSVLGIDKVTTISVDIMCPQTDVFAIKTAFVESGLYGAVPRDATSQTLKVYGYSGGFRQSFTTVLLGGAQPSTTTLEYFTCANNADALTVSAAFAAFAISGAAVGTGDFAAKVFELAVDDNVVACYREWATNADYVAASNYFIGAVQIGGFASELALITNNRWEVACGNGDLATTKAMVEQVKALSSLKNLTFFVGELPAASLVGGIHIY